MAAHNKLIFYFDEALKDTYGLSQPCRAVWLLLEVAGIPYEISLVSSRALATGEPCSKDFLAVSPAGTVPAIKDNELCLFESSAIMKYLVVQYKLPDHWYPTDIKTRAKIDEYLSWHTGNMRAGAARYIFYMYTVKILGIPKDEAKIKESETKFPKAIDLLESYFLKETQFISSNEISIADLQALCELTQFWMITIADDPMKKYLERPRIAKWIEDCMKDLSPHFDKVHDAVYKVRDQALFN